MVIFHPPSPHEDDEEEFDIGQSMTLDDQYNIDSTLYCSPQASQKLGGESSESSAPRSPDTPLVTSHATSLLSASRSNENVNILHNNELYDYLVARNREPGIQISNKRYY